MTLCSICKEKPVATREGAHLCPECEKNMLEGITLSFPEGCTVIEEGALTSPFLYRLEIPSTVTTVKSAFGRHLEEVVIPDSVTSFHPPLCIPSDALRSIKLGKGVTEIPPHAFLGKTYLSDVTLSEGLTEIGNSAFYSCTRLASLVFPTTLTRICDMAFTKSALRTLKAGNALRALGDRSFMDSPHLTDVDITSDEGITVGSEAFADCTALEKVTLRGRVTKIDTSAFRGCTSLREVTLPRETEFLGDAIFAYCAEGLTVRFEGPWEEWVTLAVHETSEGKETVSGPLDHYPYYRSGGETERTFTYTRCFDRGIKSLTVICADGKTLAYGESVWKK